MGLVHRSVKFHYANLSNLTHAKDSKSLIWKGCNDFCDHSFSFIFAHCSPAMSATQDVMSVWCVFEVMLHPCPVWVCEVKKPLLYWCLANEHWQKDLGHAKRSLSVARFHATLSWPQLELLGLVTGQGGHHGNGSQVATPMMAIFMSVANTKLARKEKCANFTLVATIAPGPGQWLPTHQRNANMPSRPPIHSFSCQLWRMYRANVSSPSSTHSHNNPSAKICHAHWAFFSWGDVCCVWPCGLKVAWAAWAFSLWLALCKTSFT